MEFMVEGSELRACTARIENQSLDPKFLESA